jgi:hypothetical protein
MKPHIIVLMALSLSACATMLPVEQRKTQYIETTTAKRAAAYGRALAYLSKNFGDANEAIKLKDSESGQIVAKGNVTCNALRQWGDVNEYSLRFNLDFQAKDNKVRLVFEELEMISAAGAPVEWDYNQISSAANLEKAKSCLEPIRSEVLKAISAGADNW